MSRRTKFIILIVAVAVAALLLLRPLGRLQPYKYEKGNSAAEHLSAQRVQIMMPERLISVINPQPSSTVLDIGAGYGLLSFPLARTVGPAGKVFATDVEPQVISYLAERSRKENLPNLFPVKVKPVGVDPFYEQQAWDLIVVSDVLPDIVMADRFLSKIRRNLKRESGRLWAIVAKIDPDFSATDFQDPKLIEALRSSAVTSTVGPRFRPSVRQALAGKKPAATVIPLLVDDLNRLLEDRTLWPEAQGGKWPVGKRYGEIMHGLSRMLEREGAFERRGGTIGEGARHRLRLLNRLVLMEVLGVHVWGEAIAWADLSTKDARHLLEQLEGPVAPKQGVKDLFRGAGYRLVRDHEMPYYSVYEFMNGGS